MTQPLQPIHPQPAKPEAPKKIKIPDGAPNDTGIFDPGPYGNGGSGDMYDPVAYRKEGYLKEINPFPANNGNNVIEDYSFEYVTHVAGGGVFASSSRLTTAFHYDYHGTKLYGLGGNDTIRGFGGNDILDGGDGDDFLDGGYQDDTLWGGDGKDYLIGGDGNDDMHGGKGDDYLAGGFDNDTLVGDEGADYMAGGYGDDVYVVDNEGDYVQEPDNLGDIFDKVYTTLGSYDLAAPGKGWGIDHLQYTGDGTFFGYGNELNNVIVGARFTDTLAGRDGDDHLIGNEGRDALYGQADNDTLDGGTDADWMYGGTGNDVYIVENAGDRVYEDVAAWGGEDKIYTTLNSFDMRASDKGAGVENLQYTGEGNFVGRGNDLHNILVGAAGGDRLYGYAGNDILVGGEGQDTLDGGADNDLLIGEGGADTMEGGAGNDTYYVDNVGDVVSEEIVAPLSGGSTATSLTGGGLGSKISIVSTTATPASGVLGEWSDPDTTTLDDPGGTAVDAGGNDTIITTLASYDLSRAWNSAFAVPSGSANILFGVVENLTYSGTERFTGIGNDANNVITGGGLSDNLYGGLGHDTLRGGAGNDGIDLGIGDDKAFIDNGTAEGGDVVVGGGGFDAVYADDSTIAGGLRLNVFRAGTGYTPDVNRVAFTSAAIDVDFIEGNAGNDVIDASRLGAGEGLTVWGLAGNDRFVSGAGSNTFYGHEDSDTIVLAGKRVDYTLVPDAEGFVGWTKIVHTATGNFDWIHSVETVEFADGAFATADLLAAAAHIVGTEGDDTLVGTAADNTIDALGGNDTIDGRGGTDTVNAGAGNDRILIGGKVLETGLDIVDGGADTDTIDFSSLDGSVNISLASGGFGMTAADGLSAAGGSPRLSNLENVIGSAYGDTIAGDGGANVLTGGLGADTLTAGAGQDTLIADNADTVDGGEGSDAVFADASTAAAGFRFNVAGTGVENVFAGIGNDVVDASGLPASSPLTQIWGNVGDDTLIGGGGIEWLDGGEGVDTAVFAGNRADYIVAQQSTNGANDWTGWTTITHTATGVTDWTIGVEKLQFADATVEAAPLPLQAATAGADVIAASDAGDVVSGLAGDDRLSGGAGSDTLVGGAGADALVGGAGTDLLYVDSADSLVDGGEGYDYVYADDSTGHTGLRLTVANTNVEFVYGNVGNDVIDASGLATGINIVGGWGDDVLTGGAEWDCVYGGEGNDTVLGKDGGDWLGGDGGDDVLTGGAGADTFFFGSDGLSGIAGAAGHDTITDFTAADGDRFDLTGYAGVKSLADLSLADNAEGNAVIGFGENTITLLGVSAASLDQSHFLFGG